MEDPSRTNSELIKEISALKQKIKELEQSESERKRASDALPESEEYFKAIIQNSSDIILIVDRLGTITYASSSVERFLGYGPEELIGKRSFDLIVSDDKPRAIADFGRALLTKEVPIPNVFRIRHKNGTERILEGIGNNLFYNPIVAGFVMNVRDVTERKKAEEALQESEERYRSILENIEDGYFEVDLAGNLTFCNDSVCRMVGQTHAEMMGMNNRQYTDKENSQILYQAFNKIFRTGEPSKGVGYEIIGKEGTKLYIESSVSLIKNTSGQPIGFRGIMRNITERKRAEEANRNAEAHYHALFEQSPNGILLIDSETGKTIEANETAYKQLGYTREDFGALRISDYETLEKPEETAKHIQKVIHDGIDNFETLHRTKSGEIRNVHVWAKKVQLSNHSFIYTLFQDITDRKQAEEALRDSQRQQKAILDNIPDIAWLKDRENRFIAVNGPFGKSCGFKPEDLVGKTDFDIWPRDLAERYRADDKEVMESGKRKQVEEPLTDSEGKTLWIETIKTPIYDERGNFAGTVGIARYITERKRAEEALQRSTEQLRKALGATVQCIAAVVETRDPYTAGHQKRVADLARAIAQEMGLTGDLVDGLRMAAVIHDIGKISVPAEILSKPTKLTDIEFSLIKIHPQSGYDILKDVEFPWPIARMVLEHHERINGTGYPNALTGEKLLIESRILAVADVVESMASHRPYRPAIGIDAALEEITKNRASLYDPEAVDACLQLFKEKGYRLTEV